MSSLPGVTLAVCAAAVSLIVSGCGGGGGPSTTPSPGPGTTPAPPGPPGPPGPTTVATTVIVTTTTVTTTFHSTACRADQGQCTSCLDHHCKGCNAGYVLDHSVPGSRCAASCVSPAKPARPATPFDLNGKEWPKLCINETSAHFFGIGDWGGIGQPGHTWTNPGRCSGIQSPILTAAHWTAAAANASALSRPCTDADHWAQKYVARQMRKVAVTSKPDYVLNVGDNYYPGGLTYGCGAGGNKPPADPTGQWKRNFDEVYSNSPGLDGKPWMSVLGNHDYGGYTWVNGWDQQIFQTWERDNWIMPGQFWSRKVQYADFAVEYLFLESGWVDVQDPGDANHYICQKAPTHTCWNITQENCPQKLFRDQWAGGAAMSEKILSASTSEWHIIVTHFPPPTVILDNGFKTLHEKYGIDLVFTGHTHFQRTGVQNGIPWIISGGGGGVTTDGGVPIDSGHDQTYGFVDFEINRTNLKFDMQTWGGKAAEIVIEKTVTLSSHKHKQSLPKAVVV